MPALPIFAGWFLLVLATLALLLWLTVAGRLVRLARLRPSVREGRGAIGDTTAWPPVSVVIPAHNEERVVDACVRSLRDQDYPNLEIIFVLDRCTDDTRNILSRHAAEDDRVRFVENETCPDDWAGKCNAARCGAELASGDFLLFTDADTIFAPDLIRAAVTLARTHALALLSILSTLTTHHRYERIAQPVASINLIRLYPIERVNTDRNPRPFANGQFMLFRRQDYDTLGGHAAVKSALLEDIAFARAVHASGGRTGVFVADGMLVCSMYDTFAAFRTGWKRIYIEACNRRPDRLRKNAWRTMVVGVGIPLLQIATFGVGVAFAAGSARTLGVALMGVAGAGFLTQLGALLYMYRLCGAPLTAVAGYPLGAWAVAGIMREAADDLERRRPIAWGGREYVLEPR
ncbi:MAG: glycosyltransferase [Phycisphaerales bacterium]|nr:glycosyltransferase [Phycisphaerae bacterium]NNF41957.1 glycosyltransferase [Phycisphaerales bacterium]NNM27454.1 glycosyltransferase [Phycisphaerales bacterium]